MSITDPRAAPKVDVEVFVIVHTSDSTVTVQPGHPEAIASAYLITASCASEVPTDQELDTAVSDFIQKNSFPPNSAIFAITASDAVRYDLALSLTRK